MADELPLPVSVYDRPSIALANILAGRWAAAGKALTAPESLSPSELKTLRMKLSEDEDQPGILKTILDISTNPVFVMGVLTSLAFPPPSARQLYEWGSSLARNSRGIQGILAWISSPARIFHGTEVWKIMKDHVFRITELKAPVASALNEIQQRYERESGQKLSMKSWYKITAHLDGLDSMEGYLASRMNEQGAKITRPLLANLRLTEAEKNAAQWVRERIFDPLYEEADKAFREIKSDRDKRVFMDNWREGLLRRGFVVPRMGETAELAKLMVKPGKYVKHYWPHMIVPTRYQSRAMGQEIQMYSDIEGKTFSELAASKEKVTPRKLALADLDEKAYARAMLGGLVMREVSPRMLSRVPGVGMFPSDYALRKYLWEYVDQETYARMQKFIDERAAKNRNLIVQGLMKAPGAKPRYAKTYLAHCLELVGYNKWSAQSLASDLFELKKSGRIGDAMSIIDGITARHNAVLEYSLDPSSIAAYVNSVAPEISWTLEGRGASLANAAKALNPQASYFLANYYVPLLRGKQTPKQQAMNIMVGEYELKTLERLESPWAKKYIPDRTRRWMIDTIEQVRQLPSSSLPGKISSYFFISTLGFNPSPALKNLLQTTITTMAVMGPVAWGRGLATTISRFVGPGGYLEARAAGLSDAEAMTRAYPEFEKALLEPALIGRQIKEGASGIEGMLPTLKLVSTRAGEVAEKIKDKALWMFSQTERFNRLLTFYAAHDSLMLEGLTTAETSGLSRSAARQMLQRKAMEFGWEMVQRTQFPAGVLGIPPALVNLPGPARQFMWFPLHYIGFLASPKTMGGGPGMLGRVAATSAALYYGARDLLGIDISSGLAWGALPMPTYEKSPFFPFPIVPPLFSAAGGIASSVLSGDMSRISESLALLVPAGVTLRRALPVAVPGAARALGLSWADYENPDEQGRIPLYDQKGALVGMFSPVQLYMRAIGLNPFDVVQERALSMYLVRQRDAIREYRREYVEALAANDMRKAEDVNSEFMRRYPELGPIQLKRTDIQALENRRTLSRLSRITKSIPAEYRPEFESAATATLAGSLVGAAWTAPESLSSMLTAISTPRTSPSFAGAGLPTIGEESPYGSSASLWPNPAFQPSIQQELPAAAAGSM